MMAFCSLDFIYYRCNLQSSSYYSIPPTHACKESWHSSYMECLKEIVHMYDESNYMYYDSLRLSVIGDMAHWGGKTWTYM